MQKAWQLLDSPDKWLQGVSVKNAKGEPLTVVDNTAVSWCLVSAVQSCYKNWDALSAQLRRVCEHLKISADPLVSDFVLLARWQDEPDRTYKEVHSLLKRLDI